MLWRMGYLQRKDKLSLQWSLRMPGTPALRPELVDGGGGVVRSGRVVRVGAAVAVHREERIPAVDVLADVHLVQVHLRAAQSLVVLEAHAPLPHHDDDVAPKDVRALCIYLHADSQFVIRYSLYVRVITWHPIKNMARAQRGASSTCDGVKPLHTLFKL